MQARVLYAIHRLHLPSCSSSSSSSCVLQQDLHTSRVPSISGVHHRQPFPRPNRKVRLGRILSEEALNEVGRVFFFFFLLCFVFVVVVGLMVVTCGGGVEGRQGRWERRAAAMTERRSRDEDGGHTCFLFGGKEGRAVWACADE